MMHDIAEESMAKSLAAYQPLKPDGSQGPGFVACYNRYAVQQMRNAARGLVRQAKHARIRLYDPTDEAFAVRMHKARQAQQGFRSKHMPSGADALPDNDGEGGYRGPQRSSKLKKAENKSGPVRVRQATPEERERFGINAWQKGHRGPLHRGRCTSDCIPLKAKETGMLGVRWVV